MLPFQGELKEVDSLPSNNEPMDIYEVVALAKRLNISFNEMKEITLITLINILISSVKDDTTKASQKDIDAFLR